MQKSSRCFHCLSVDLTYVPTVCSCCRVPEEASEKVADLIMDCLRHDPALRPTAKELVEILTTLE